MVSRGPSLPEVQQADKGLGKEAAQCVDWKTSSDTERQKQVWNREDVMFPREEFSDVQEKQNKIL